MVRNFLRNVISDQVDECRFYLVDEVQIRSDFGFGFWVDALHGLPIVVGEEGVGGQEWVQYFGDLRSNVGVLVQVFPVGIGVECGDFCGRILEARGKKLRQ